MSKKSKQSNLFLYNFVFFIGLNIIVNVTCKYLAVHDLLFQNPIFRLTFVHNTGAAFSILDSQISFLIAVGFLALIYIASKVYFSDTALNKPSTIGFALMAAGIVHNIYERIYLGYVLDYFDLNFVRFPVFNMADILICSGAVLIIYQILVKKL